MLDVALGEMGMSLRQLELVPDNALTTLRLYCVSAPVHHSANMVFGKINMLIGGISGSCHRPPVSISHGAPFLYHDESRRFQVQVVSSIVAVQYPKKSGELRIVSGYVRKLMRRIRGGVPTMDPLFSTRSLDTRW